MRISRAPEPGTAAGKTPRRTSDRTRVAPGRSDVVTVVEGPPPRGRNVRSTGTAASGAPGSAGGAPRKTSLEKTAPFRPTAAATAGTVQKEALALLGNAGLKKGSFVGAFATTVP